MSERIFDERLHDEQRNTGACRLVGRVNRDVQTLKPEMSRTTPAVSPARASDAML